MGLAQDSEPTNQIPATRKLIFAKAANDYKGR